MTLPTIIILALCLGILLSGGVVAWFSIDEPRNSVNVVVLTVGLAFLAYGHLQWAVKREDPQVKQALFIRHVIAGWALVGMGYVGLQIHASRSASES